jgi:hypothetical protein
MELLEDVRVPVRVVVGPWLKTAFAGFVSNELCGRIWDLWLVHGFDLLLRLSLALLVRAAPALERLPSMEFLRAVSPSTLAQFAIGDASEEEVIRLCLED